MRVEVTATVMVSFSFHALAASPEEALVERARFILAQRIPEGVPVSLELLREPGPMNSRKEE